MILPDEKCKKIAYELAEKLAGYELTTDEATLVVSYLKERILPFQISKSLENWEPPRFKVVIPDTLS